ncbi:hypothetical protein Lal_00027953 [Lupinus albus]|nr:hypothetical protein Lal_00027953 [Lupinus albus]
MCWWWCRRLCSSVRLWLIPFVGLSVYAHAKSNCGVWVWCNHRREEVLGCVEMSVRTLFHDVVAMIRGFKPLSKIIFGKT